MHLKHILALVAVCGLAAIPIACAAAQADTPTEPRPVSTVAPADPTGDGEWYRAVNRWNYTVAVNEYQTRLWYAEAMRQEAERAAAAEAERVEAERRAAAATVKSPVAPPAPTGRGGGGGSTVGGSCGGATNGADRFIAAESSGNPNARNPSGAWGCYQIMPYSWKNYGCDELGSHGSASVEAQAQCASRMPSSSWAATGG